VPTLCQEQAGQLVRHLQQQRKQLQPNQHRRRARHMRAPALQPSHLAGHSPLLQTSPASHRVNRFSQADAVASPYGNALVEVARKTNSLEAVHADVDALASLLKENGVRGLVCAVGGWGCRGLLGLHRGIICMIGRWLVRAHFQKCCLVIWGCVLELKCRKGTYRKSAGRVQWDI